MSDDPWQTEPTAFPRGGTAAEKWHYLLNWAVLAPSTHNSQPWLFHIRGDLLQILADRRRALPVVDPHDRELTLSIGALIGTLSVALRGLGLDATVSLLPADHDPDLMATVVLAEGPPPTAEETELFRAIPRRRTTRHPFDPAPLDETVLGDLATAATVDHVRTILVTDDETRGQVADLVSAADRLQFADRAFRRELAAWLHSRRSASRDGLSVAGMGGPDLLTRPAAWVMRTFDLGSDVAAKDHELAAHSPALAVLASDADTPRAWLEAGQELARLLLTATARGLTASHLNQPIEVEQLRPALGELTRVSGHPQILLRLGRGPKVPPSPRRPVAEVVIDG